jgi:cellobiose-specific phosphotransferase system component IIA
MPEDEPKKNGLLRTIFAGGDTSVKLLTMALIVISGGGNFFATNNLSREEREDRDRAIREIHAVHDAIESALRRQKEMADTVDQLNRKLNK